MSTIVDCPSCSRKLRVPDELLGKKVKCPTCSGIFDAVADPAPVKLPSPEPSRMPRPAPASDNPSPLASSRGADTTPLAKSEDRKLELGNEGQAPTGVEIPSPAPSTPSETPAGSVPVSEQETLTHPGSEQLADQDLAPCPYCGEKIAKEATRCQFCGEELREEDKGVDRPWDQDYRPYRDVRRDSEPHRGTLILTLGIVSIVMSVTWFLGIIGLIIGICAWFMGQRDLRKMRANIMDPQGLGSTQAGWICGIIGTVFGGLMSLCCLAYVGWIVFMMTSMSRMTPPPPTPAPAGPVARPAPAPAEKKMEKVAPNAPAPPPVKKEK